MYSSVLQKCTWAAELDQSESPHNKIDWQRTEKVLPNVLKAIGNTPLVKLNKIPESMGVSCEMYKDRFAYRAIIEAEREGLLKPDGVIIIMAPGCTGISVAFVAAVTGHPCKVIVYDDITYAREALLKLLGAEIYKASTSASSSAENSKQAILKRLQEETPNSFVLDPCKNINNPLAYYDTTAEEILDALDQQVDMLVVISKSGGTLTGLGRKFKEKNPDCIIIGAEELLDSENDLPEEIIAGQESSQSFSGVMEKELFFNATLADMSIIDKWIKLEKTEGILMARRIISEEGILAGISSGLSLAAAINEAKYLDSDKKCVILFYDSIRDYTDQYILDQWMEYKRLVPCYNPQPETYWWWDNNVSELKLKPLQVADESMDCHRVIHIMKKFKIEQVPIVNYKNSLIASIELSPLLNKIISGEVHSKDNVMKAVGKKYPFLEQGNSVTIGLVTRMLELNKYVIIYTMSTEEAGIIKKCKGVIKAVDILQYIEANDPKKV